RAGRIDVPLVVDRDAVRVGGPPDEDEPAGKAGRATEDGAVLERLHAGAEARVGMRVHGTLLKGVKRTGRAPVAWVWNRPRQNACGVATLPEGAAGLTKPRKRALRSEPRKANSNPLRLAARMSSSPLWSMSALPTSTTPCWAPKGKN